MVEMEYKDQNQRVDFAYVKIPFDELDNTDVALNDSDYSTYLSENAAQYQSEEETRKLEYAVFNVEPTSADSANWRQQIVDLIPDFRSAENDSSFVERNLGTISASSVVELLGSARRNVCATSMSIAKPSINNSFLQRLIEFL